MAVPAYGEASWADEKRNLASKNDVFVGTRTTAGSQQWRARITRLHIVVQPGAGAGDGLFRGSLQHSHVLHSPNPTGFETKGKGDTDIGGRCRQVTSGINHLLSL